MKMRNAAVIAMFLMGVALYGCGDGSGTGMPGAGASGAENTWEPEMQAADGQGVGTAEPEMTETEIPEGKLPEDEMPEGKIPEDEMPEAGSTGGGRQEPCQLPLGESTVAMQAGPYGRISLSIPPGWSYETYPADSDGLMCGMYGIHFYPEAAGEGYVELAYMNSFGVCGTGLLTEAITLAGNPANKGTYDNHGYWDFIAFHEGYEGIVALTFSVDGWWEEYGDQTLEILDTVSFDQSIREGGAYLYDAESEISGIGLLFSLKNISAAGATLVFHQYNADAPTGELQYGSDFVLETWQEGKWVSVPVIVQGDYAFTAAGYRIASGESTEREVDWKWLYGELAPGTYRLGKSIQDCRESGDCDSYMVYAHFIWE